MFDPRIWPITFGSLDRKTGRQGMLKTILLNAANKQNLSVMLNKLLKRFEADTSKEALEWARRHASVEIAEFCSEIDEPLWQETLAECKKIRARSEEALAKIPYNLGGGGSYPLLYFLVRNNRPSVVFETGVAAGWSSTTILSALRANKNGVLYSSDFPYFRIEDPERYIGVLVAEEDKCVWQLNTRGDSYAVPQFLNSIKGRKVGLLHYDSDKSYSGRALVMKLLEPNFTEVAVLIMDDIQDNVFFRDYTRDRNLEYKVFEFEGKYVGVVPDIGAQLDRRA